MNEKEMLEAFNTIQKIELPDGFVYIKDNGQLVIWQGTIGEYNADEYAKDIHITFQNGRITVAYTPTPHKFYTHNHWIDSHHSFGKEVDPDDTDILPEYIQTKEVTIIVGLFRTKRITNKILFVPYDTPLPTNERRRKVLTTSNFRVNLAPETIKNV